MAAISHHTISMDGFVAGPDDSMDWAFRYGDATSLAAETMGRIGAIVAGRRWYELAAERWNGVDGIYGGAYEGKVFVLTHEPPGEAWDPRIEFVSGGIEEALGVAQAAAGGKDVGVFGGTLTRQALEVGLLDEVVLHVAPVLLGGGIRLFEGLDQPLELERISVGEAERLTDFRFRVVPSPGRGG
jgi:dihydrofolate reductase